MSDKVRGIKIGPPSLAVQKMVQELIKKIVPTLVEGLRDISSTRLSEEVGISVEEAVDLDIFPNLPTEADTKEVILKLREAIAELAHVIYMTHRLSYEVKKLAEENGLTPEEAIEAVDVTRINKDEFNQTRTSKTSVFGGSNN